MIEARDGEEAWRLLQERRPDLIITDINMPKRSGIELIQMVRRQRLTVSLPIMVMSAYDSGHLKDAMQAGADIPLRKPEEIDRLLDLIDEVLGRESSQTTVHWHA